MEGAIMINRPMTNREIGCAIVNGIFWALIMVVVIVVATIAFNTGVTP